MVSGITFFASGTKKRNFRFIATCRVATKPTMQAHPSNAAIKISQGLIENKGLIDKIGKGGGLKGG